MATVRDYNLPAYSGTTAVVQVIDRTKASYAALPTLAECRSALGVPSIDSINLASCFYNCTNMTIAPTLPDYVTEMSGAFENCTSLTTAPTIPTRVTSLWEAFKGCTSLTTAPTIPSGITLMMGTFRGCTALTTAPTIPEGVTSLANTFYGCTALTTGANVPSTVTTMYRMYNGCSALTGDIDIRTNTANYTEMFLGTIQPITIHGLSPTYLQAIADTSPLGNITIDAVAEWLGAVTDRANANTRTTAEDMQRIVADMAYLGGVPVKLVYTPNDIVTDIEWAAIIAFAQSLDPSITDSTRYDNLNKIEQAFLDAYGG